MSEDSNGVFLYLCPGYSLLSGILGLLCGTTDDSNGSYQRKLTKAAQASVLVTSADSDSIAPLSM